MVPEPDKKIRPVLNRVTQILGGEAAEGDVREAFDEARPRSREDIMLDVRFSTGERKAFSYAYLVEIDYEPGDTLCLVFGTCKVGIEGRRLLRLYESLRQHKAKFVQEGSAAEDDLKPEESPHIDAIKILEDSEDDDARSNQEADGSGARRGHRTGASRT